jgi:hypothetical protein
MRPHAHASLSILLIRAHLDLICIEIEQLYVTILFCLFNTYKKLRRFIPINL